MWITEKSHIKLFWVSLIIFFILLLAHTPSSLGFSTHPSTTGISRIPDKFEVFTNESITVTTTFANNESISLRGFYYVDHIPQGLTVNTISITVDGNDISNNYIEESGSVGDVYTDTVPYRWILETPPAFDHNNPIDPNFVLEIVYTVTSDQEGTFSFDEFHWIGYYQDANEGERAAFGYNDTNFSVSWVQEPLTLTSLSINGQDSVNENSTATYTATASFSNNDTQLVTMDANWSVIPSQYSSISSSGDLATSEVPSDQTVTIRAEYTFADVTVEDTMTLTIVDINTDSDGDGMPDWWEDIYGLNPNTTEDASEDPDNDNFTNIEEYEGNTSPQDNSTHPIRPYILENDCYPYDGQGIEDGSIRVPTDTSIVLRLKGDAEIDTNSIVMTVTDTDNGLDISTHLRLKQIIEGDSTEYWVICSPINPFGFGDSVTVTIEVEDINGIAMNPYIFNFQVESEDEHNEAETNTPSYTDDHSNPNQYVCFVDPNTEIDGARIVYDPNEPIAPRFGPLGEIPELTISDGVGLPVALESLVVFQNPITIFIPCPGIDDVSLLDIFYYKPAAGWVKAEENDGWMLSGTRIDHSETSPPTIEIQVNYLTAVQAGLNSSAIGFIRDNATGGGCFINTIDQTSATN